MSKPLRPNSSKNSSANEPTTPSKDSLTSGKKPLSFRAASKSVTSILSSRSSSKTPKIVEQKNYEIEDLKKMKYSKVVSSMFAKYRKN